MVILGVCKYRVSRNIGGGMFGGSGNIGGVGKWSVLILGVGRYSVSGNIGRGLGIGSVVILGVGR